MLQEFQGLDDFGRSFHFRREFERTNKQILSAPKQLIKSTTRLNKQLVKVNKQLLSSPKVLFDKTNKLLKQAGIVTILSGGLSMFMHKKSKPADSGSSVDTTKASVAIEQGAKLLDASNNTLTQASNIYSTIDVSNVPNQADATALMTALMDQINTAIDMVTKASTDLDSAVTDLNTAISNNDQVAVDSITNQIPKFTQQAFDSASSSLANVTNVKDQTDTLNRNIKHTYIKSRSDYAPTQSAIPAGWVASVPKTDYATQAEHDRRKRQSDWYKRQQTYSDAILQQRLQAQQLQPQQVVPQVTNYYTTQPSVSQDTSQQTDTGQDVNLDTDTGGSDMLSDGISGLDSLYNPFDFSTREGFSSYDIDGITRKSNDIQVYSEPECGTLGDYGDDIAKAQTIAQDAGSIAALIQGQYGTKTDQQKAAGITPDFLGLPATAWYILGGLTLAGVVYAVTRK